MIRLDVVQGSEAWMRARIGIPTASRFDAIITPKTMKLSGSLEKYAHELIAEQILGQPLDGSSSAFMERGQIMEHQAVKFYEMEHDVDTDAVGFVLRDDRRVGCSPDRFVGDVGMLEIKCPSADVHVGYLLDDAGIGYKCQVQGNLWLCGREWIDTLSYNPEMPPALVRQYRDDKFVAALEAGVKYLLEYIDDCKQQLQKRGLFEGEKIPDLQIVA